MATEEFLEKANVDASLYDSYNKLKAELESCMAEWETMI